MTTPTTPTPDPAERAALRIDELTPRAGRTPARAREYRKAVRQIIREEFAASGDTAELREALDGIDSAITAIFVNAKRTGDLRVPFLGDESYHVQYTGNQFSAIADAIANARRVLAGHTP
jgi:hypothetical protein